MQDRNNPGKTLLKREATNAIVEASYNVLAQHSRQYLPEPYSAKPVCIVPQEVIDNLKDVIADYEKAMKETP